MTMQGQDRRDGSPAVPPAAPDATVWSDETLVAYLYGELEPATGERLAAALAADPQLEVRLASFRQTLDLLVWPAATARGGHFAEEVWMRLAPRLRQAEDEDGGQAHERASSDSLRAGRWSTHRGRRRGDGWSRLRNWTLGISAAAAALLLLVVGFLAGRLSGGPGAADQAAGEQELATREAPAATGGSASTASAPTEVASGSLLGAGAREPVTPPAAPSVAEWAVPAQTSPVPERGQPGGAVAAGVDAGGGAGGELAIAAAGSVGEPLLTHPAMASSTLLAGLSPAARERILFAAVAGHLERAERLLLEVANGDLTERGAVLASEARQSAAVLVAANRLYRGATAQAGARSLERTLTELEWLLLELAHLPDEETSNLEAVRERLGEAGLLFRLRVVESRLQPAATSPAPAPSSSSGVSTVRPQAGASRRSNERISSVPELSRLHRS
jgi:hypothetical protein